jgi:hypothetical protein
MQGKLEVSYAHFFPLPCPTLREFHFQEVGIGVSYQAGGVSSSLGLTGANPVSCSRNFWIEIPFWIPLVMLSAYPTIAFIRGPLRRWRRRRKGLCLKCGYNLTGLTEPRCPECATEFDRTHDFGIDIEEG